MADPVQVAIVEDHPLFRRGLVGLIEDDPEFALAAAVRSVPDLEAALTTAGVDAQVVLLDLRLAGRGPEGREAVELLRRRGLRVLVVSANAKREAVVGAIEAGANGYVSKDAEPEEILDALRVVTRGSSYISATLAGYLLDSAARARFTAREVQVLRLVARGDTDREIAAELQISPRTVGGHLDRIGAKTGERHRAALTRIAIDRGLVPPTGDTG